MGRPPGLYIRLGCDALDDEKLVSAGLDGYWLWSRGLLHSKRQLTDGYVPAKMLAAISAGMIRAPMKVAKKLVEIGLWEEAEGGFRVPSEKWSRWQTTREEVDEIRAQNTERKRRQRENRKCHADVTRDSHGTVTRQSRSVTPPEFRAQSSEHRVLTDKLPAAVASEGPVEAPFALKAEKPPAPKSGSNGLTFASMLDIWYEIERENSTTPVDRTVFQRLMVPKEGLWKAVSWCEPARYKKAVTAYYACNEPFFSGHPVSKFITSISRFMPKNSGAAYDPKWDDYKEPDNGQRLTLRVRPTGQVRDEPT